MYCWRPNFGNQFDELFDILKNGFKDPIEYKVFKVKSLPFCLAKKRGAYLHINFIDQSS